MKKRAWDTISENDVTPYDVYLNRRQFMKAAGVAGAAAALGAGRLGASGLVLPPSQEVPTPDYGADLQDEVSSFELITNHNNFYEFGVQKEDPSANAGDMRLEPWTVEVTGACNNPGTYSFEDLYRPDEIEDRIYRLRCVEAWSLVVPWRGFPLRNLLTRLEPTSNANFVAFETAVQPEAMEGIRRPVLDWPYREGLRIDEAANELAFLATGLYGQDLLPQNGAPIRLVVPWKYGFKSIKSIVRITFQEEMPPTSWNMSAPQEYGFYANVNPNVDHPRWSQSRHRPLPSFRPVPTEMFNGYADQVQHMYAGMDLARWF